jgi:hypothetical protein
MAPDPWLIASISRYICYFFLQNQISLTYRFAAYRMIYFFIHKRSEKGKRMRKKLPNCLGRYSYQYSYYFESTILLYNNDGHTHWIFTFSWSLDVQLCIYTSYAGICFFFLLKLAFFSVHGEEDFPRSWWEIHELEASHEEEKVAEMFLLPAYCGW